MPVNVVSSPDTVAPHVRSIMVKRILLYAALVLIPSSVLFAQAAPATTAGDFYSAMLRRGIVSFDAGREADAVRQLRIAAFGFVDALDLYQTAEAYLAVAYERSGDADRAREAARKVVAAQRRSPGYAALELPETVRSAFNTLATRVLTTGEVAALRSAPSSTVVTRPATTIPSRSTPPTIPPATATPSASTTTPESATIPATPTTSAASASVPASQPTATPSAQPSSAQPSSAPAKTPPPTPPASSPAPGQPAAQPKTTAIEIPFEPAEPARPAAATPPPPAPTAQPAPVAQPPAASAPAATKPATPAPPALSESETAQRLIAAERAVNSARLSEARATYRELLARGTLSRSNLIRVAEGLYRARDFTAALQAFERLGPLARGEEPYRYYLAVALYETGSYARAKNELRAVLPFIEVTPDVARYQAKIDGAVR